MAIFKLFHVTLRTWWIHCWICLVPLSITWRTRKRLLYIVRDDLATSKVTKGRNVEDGDVVFVGQFWPRLTRGWNVLWCLLTRGGRFCRKSRCCKGHWMRVKKVRRSWCWKEGWKTYPSHATTSAVYLLSNRTLRLHRSIPLFITP